jgi:hypothetical protein
MQCVEALDHGEGENTWIRVSCLGSCRMEDRITQAERLARKDALRDQIAKREAEIRDLQEELARLLADCEHTDANGQIAVAGSRTKICVHCGRIVPLHDEKLWG